MPVAGPRPLNTAGPGEHQALGPRHDGTEDRAADAAVTPAADPAPHARIAVARRPADRLGVAPTDRAVRDMPATMAPGDIDLSATPAVRRYDPTSPRWRRPQAIDAPSHPTRAPSSLALDWDGLCRQARRRHLPPWRGELPPRRDDIAPISAPLAVAAAARFGQPPSLASEAEAATFRVAAPYAVNVVRAWHDVAFDREDVVAALLALRLGETDARPRFAARWARYRRQMHRLATRIATLRATLAPYPAPAGSRQEGSR